MLNEILGRSECAPIVFGSQAPDSGNSEILAHYGTPELRGVPRAAARQPHRVVRFSMTEPQGRRPEGVHHHCGAGRRRVGDQRREVVLVVRRHRGVPHRDGGHRSRRRPTSGTRCSWCRGRHPGSTCSATWASGTSPSAAVARAMCVTRTCASPPTTCSVRARRVRRRADTARWWSHPSRHAHRRLVCDASSTCCASVCRASRRARCSATSRSCRR